MTEFQASATKYIVPITTTLLTLSTYQSEGHMLLPSINHKVPSTEIRDFAWESFDSARSLVERQDTSDFQVVEGFASALVGLSVDIPPDFAAMLNDEFWNLV